VKHTITSENRSRLTAENIIENGVRHTEIGWHQCNNIDDAIEKGVKETMFNQGHKQLTVKNIIENGVKETNKSLRIDGSLVIEDTIQNGVKLTQFNDNENKSWVEGVIKNGVKETHDDVYHHKGRIDGVIKNGVKETKGHGFEQQNIIDDIVKDGVKETKTPGKDGDILSTIEWMEENKSTSYTKMIDDVIDNGEKINGTYVGGNRQKENIESVIGYGTKNPSV
jgi:hypothetical protein